MEDDIEFNRIQMGWSVYIFEDKKLYIRPELVEISRTKAFDRLGIPIYQLKHQLIIKVKPVESESSR